MYVQRHICIVMEAERHTGLQLDVYIIHYYSCIIIYNVLASPKMRTEHTHVMMV